jgi:hypothetical protein
VDQALRWLQSPVPVLHSGALHVLACIDEPRAARAVIQSIRQRRIGSGYYAHPYNALRRREWPDEAYRWQYLRAIMETLQERLARQPKDRKTVRAHDDEEVRSLPGLVVVLEAIAQVAQGPHGGEAMGMVVDLEALRATTAKWRTWMNENDPETTKRAGP